MKYDAIIIGAGLGGLTAGAKLAKEGMKVLVVEQHSKPGGCATTFQRGDFTFEAGLHEMDGPSPGDMKTRVFSELEVFDNVAFLKVPEFYHFVNGRISITVPHDPVLAAKILKDAFPGESSGIDFYFNRLLNPRRKGPGEETIKDTSLGEFLDSIIGDEDLKLVLLGNLGYFHDDPYSLSLAYYSAAQGSYYRNGASFIKGGSQALSDHLAGFIRKHGGEVILNSLVTQIFEEKGNLAGVKYEAGNNRGSAQAVTAYGNEIIANAAIPAIAELLPETRGRILKEEIKSLKPGASLLTVYFGFNGLLKDIGNQYYSTFVFDASVRKQADIIKNNKGDFSTRSFAFVDYGMLGSDLAPAGKSAGALCCIDYPGDWENLSKAEYRAKKKRVTEIFLGRLESLIPGITALTAFSEAGTSLTIKRYTLNPGGAVYGFAQHPGKQVPDISAVSGNLHIASAWGKTGGGFSGAILGGYLTAFNILRRK